MVVITYSPKASKIASECLVIDMLNLWMVLGSSAELLCSFFHAHYSVEI